MNSFIGMVIFSLLALGLVISANAEIHGGLNPIEIKTYEAINADIQKYYELWEIPVEFPVANNGLSCVTDFSISPIEKICTFVSRITIEELQNEYTYDYDTETMRPTAEVEAEAIIQCEEDPTCPLGFYIPITEATKWSEELAKVEATKEESPTKEKLIELINEMLDKPSQCYQGVGTTAGSQETRSFDIPTYEITDEFGNKRLVLDTRTTITDLGLRGILGQIMADARECAAQIILLDVQGGVMSQVDTNFAYCDTVDLKDTSQQVRCGKTYDHQTNAQDVPVWSQQRVNEEANRDLDTPVWNILDNVCKGYYQHSYKMIFQECKDYFALRGEQETYAERQQMKYYDDSSYQNFLEYGDEEQYQKILEERLREKIQQAYREYNAFK